MIGPSKGARLAERLVVIRPAMRCRKLSAIELAGKHFGVWPIDR